MWKMVGVVLALLWLLFLSGCSKGLTAEEMEMQRQQVKMVVDALSATDVEAMGYLKLPLNVGMFNEVKFGSDGEILILLSANAGNPYVQTESLARLPAIYQEDKLKIGTEGEGVE